MNATELIGRALGVEQAQAIQRMQVSLAAPWVQGGWGWLLLGCLGLAALVVLIFYALCQGRRRMGPRIGLAALRVSLLVLVVIILAEPVLRFQITSRKRPSLWLLFDGTDSMAVADELPEAERARLDQSLGRPAQKPPSGQPATAATLPTRADYIKALIQNRDGDLLARLGEKFRLRAFLFDRAEGVRSLELSSNGAPGIEPEHLAQQLTTDGEVTALGGALNDLARRHATGNLAGLVILSDFNQNAGPAAVEAAKRLGVKVHTVGVGPAAAVDLGVDLQAPPLMKKDERSTLTATVRQDGFTGQMVDVRFLAQRLGGPAGRTAAVPIGQKSLRLSDAAGTVELPYVPDQTGRFVFSVEVEPLEGEVIGENNRAAREGTVRDDFIRLLFVEYEPTWEWRFVKEVFHRDKLVGQRGFRTFLRSADPKVRMTDPLFMTTLSPPRSEFFANDVIVLGDMPAAALSPRFCKMAEEFVGNFGGGLVVLAGPRFGPGQLAETKLDELLPVKIDPAARFRDRQPFLLRRTADAAQYDFMQLGDHGAENEKAWGNLGPLPWYQPVLRLRPLATALAEHPEATCVDAKTPQPLLAVQNYGRGEVVYLGFNETWRLRRKYGERYYRQFWGQLIHRLALRHALGSQKRFVVRTDRRRYRADDEVVLTVEAYDADFEPLSEDKLPGRKLAAELILPGPGSLDESNVRPLGISQLREGVFETRIPVFDAGEYHVRVKDPVTREYVEVVFRVARVSAERQRAVRNDALAQAVADATGGKSYDLVSAGKLPDEIELVAETETSVEVVSLWDTWLCWLCFGCVMGLMLGEWLGRKWVNLP